jgi:probable rRNA maturation factor
MPRRIPVQVLPGCRGRISVPELRRIARRLLSAEEVAGHVGVEIVLADAETVRDLNRLYRGKDEATDVLSFSGMEEQQPPDGMERVSPVEFIEPLLEEVSLGEVIVCVPVAESQARAAIEAGDRGRTVQGEIVHLLVHGMLHLLEYDHEDAGDAAAMREREDAHLAALGYEGTYAHGE